MRTCHLPLVLLCIVCVLGAEPKGDPLPEGAVARLGTAQPRDERPKASVRHTSEVQSILFFPDGKRLLSCDGSGNLIVWDIASGKVLAHHQKSQYKYRTLRVGTDGNTVQFLTFDYLIRRWNPAEGGEANREKFPPGNPIDFVLSPDGRTLAATYGSHLSQVRLHDLRNGTSRTLKLPVETRVGTMLFSPNSRLLLTNSSNYTQRLWNRDTGKLVREVPSVDPLRGPQYWTFAEDSRSLVYYDHASRYHLCIREIASGGQRLKVPSPRTGSPALASSPNGRFLACEYGFGGVFVLDTATGKEAARWSGEQGVIYSLAFSPDSRLLASGGGDGMIYLWKMPDGEGLPTTLKEEESAALWQALAGDDAARAHRALAGLAAAPAQAVPLIKQRFRTSWKKPDAKRLAHLIAELDADVFAARERASHELSEANFAAADALRQALAKTPSAEAKKRMEGLLNRLNLGGSPERLRSLRAIEVLERIGTPQAADVLRELADKPLPEDLHDDIKASLRRMNARSPAASRRSPTP